MSEEKRLPFAGYASGVNQSINQSSFIHGISSLKTLFQ